MSKKPKADQGFTLLEVIVALAIMATGFATILQLFSTSIRTVEISDGYLKGISLAHNKMNGLELDDFVIDETSGVFENEENYRWELQIDPYESALNQLESNIEIVRIALNVFWNQGEDEKNVELVTLRTVGTTFTTTDSVWLGTEKSGIYGQIGGGGVLVGAPVAPGLQTDLERSPDNQDSEPEIKFCGKELPDIIISGNDTSGPAELRVSGA